MTIATVEKPRDCLVTFRKRRVNNKAYRIFKVVTTTNESLATRRWRSWLPKLLLVLSRLTLTKLLSMPRLTKSFKTTLSPWLRKLQEQTRKWQFPLLPVCLDCRRVGMSSLLAVWSEYLLMVCHRWFRCGLALVVDQSWYCVWGCYCSWIWGCLRGSWSDVALVHWSGFGRMSIVSGLFPFVFVTRCVEVVETALSKILFRMND
jgi:hypothetical protein